MCASVRLGSRRAVVGLVDERPQTVVRCEATARHVYAHAYMPIHMASAARPFFLAVQGMVRGSNGSGAWQMNEQLNKAAGGSEYDKETGHFMQRALAASGDGALGLVCFPIHLCHFVEQSSVQNSGLI